MSKHDPIAYIYEASEHCPTCAETRFGRAANGFIAGADADGNYPLDDEGNEVGVVAPWEAFEDRDMSCGTCGDLINAIGQTDIFGRIWPSDYECCDECGQPDNCGECTHGMHDAQEAIDLGAIGGTQ